MKLTAGKIFLTGFTIVSLLGKGTLYHAFAAESKSQPLPETRKNVVVLARRTGFLPNKVSYFEFKNPEKEIEVMKSVAKAVGSGAGAADNTSKMAGSKELSGKNGQASLFYNVDKNKLNAAQSGKYINPSPAAMPDSINSQKYEETSTSEGFKSAKPAKEPSPSVTPSPAPVSSAPPEAKPSPEVTKSPQVFPISIYKNETNITFKPGKWGDIEASVVKEGIDGSNCIKYTGLEYSVYAPGPEIIFEKPVDISGMVDSDRLQLVMDIGNVTTSQAVRIIFNGNPELNIVTPKLNNTNVYEVLNLDISHIRAKLEGRIVKMSFESAGSNGWEHTEKLIVDEIKIIRPNGQVPLIAPVPAPKLNSMTFPLSVYKDESNIKFQRGKWGDIQGSIASEGVGNSKCIKYSGLNNNVYAPGPAVVFLVPVNVTSMKNTDRLQLKMDLGDTERPQAVRVILNGNPSLNIVTPKIDAVKGFETISLDISSLREKLGGQIAQISFESAGSNGWEHVEALYVDDINIIRP